MGYKTGIIRISKGDAWFCKKKRDYGLFVRFLLCLDRASRGDRYEDKILADIILFRHFGSTFIVVLHAYPRFNDADFGFSDTDIGSNYARGKI